jgi:hypothetical protein
MNRGGILVLVLAVLCLAAGVFAWTRKPVSPVPPARGGDVANFAQAATNELSTMDVNQAVMVTVELDFNGPPPSIAEAIKEIERRHQPDAGGGRVFAILDAYGEPTPDGKKLHMSMHVSSEKPGIGSLVFKRTGQTLWSSRVVASTNAHSSFSGGALTIFFDNGSGAMFTVDGSKNPSTILDAPIKEVGRPLRDLWLDNAEHEMTFIYSACGCPVKAMCRRIGERTVRSKELPVIFPDDPAVVQIISRLMGW